MRHETSTIETFDHIELYTQRWLPERAPIAVVAIVHGVGEHSGRYGRLVEGLVPKGYALWGVDHRGHGRSPGPRGHINAWSDYRRDTAHYLEQVRAAHSETPLFLFGHSMGAAIALDYMLRRPEDVAQLNGVILSGTPLAPAAKPWLAAIAKTLSHLWPRLALSRGMETEACSRNPEVQRALSADPLAQPKSTVRWGAEFLKAVAGIREHPGQVTRPILMVHGGEDPLCDVEVVRSWFELVPYPDKRLLVYPESRHEMHNDFDYVDLIEDLDAWMRDHLNERPELDGGSIGMPRAHDSRSRKQ